MTMQHKDIFGTPIGVNAGERFKDRMKRIAMAHRTAASCPVTGDSPWMVLRVDSGREKAVKNALEEARIECLVPMRRGPELRRRHRIIPPTLIPVMVGYVLVRCLVSDRALAGLRSFDHVRDVLGGWISPILSDAEKVKLFNENADEGRYDWEKPVTVFRQGDKVKITEGPFAHFKAVIVSCRDDGKGDAVVEFPMFGVLRPILIPLALLEKL
ncbi:transcriptional antiterminator NusG [Neorhizobium sp. R1-B]|uniref:transcription termination/antitermination protein NusG n=1 Tax=Neorhizobium sp. R1-B TaxID=2485162 RepID=UPI00106657F7|nr:transcription termination/antitermination NusG family protein [Neorhizobium sp. R1-B]TDX72611.1 transcriptional antiterminator NusG [Neorhizobium sp. R1-B]